MCVTSVSATEKKDRGRCISFFYLLHHCDNCPGLQALVADAAHCINGTRCAMPGCVYARAVELHILLSYHEPSKSSRC